MATPRADRPHMPGYGIVGADQGRGLLAWSWAEDRLRRSHDYWVATVRPEQRPHVMPVWGVWHDERLWFSSSNASRKTRNLAANPWCAIATDDAHEPVVVEGTVEVVRNAAAIEAYALLVNDKYETDYETSFYDPAANSVFEVTPSWAFSLTEDDFSGSPTRWVFDT